MIPSLPGHGPNSTPLITPKQLEARKQWVDLLRSGNFRQTKGKLATLSGKYRCCLGVACELDPNIEVTVVRQHNKSTRVLAFDGNFETLPGSLMEILGMNDDNPNVIDPDDDGSYALAFLNDNQGKSFEQIADAIERDYIDPYA